MGVFEKLKNALFEEEYVEVEEKPKKIKNKDMFDKKHNDKPIAKKVVLPEKKEVKVETLPKNEIIDDFGDEEELIEKTSKMASLDDNNENLSIRIEEVKPIEEKEPEIVKVLDKDEELDIYNTCNNINTNTSVNNINSSLNSYSNNAYNNEGYHLDENKYYQTKPEKPYYGLQSSKINEYGGAYEKKEARTHFTPSPIISPIYGILDKNYKKEDVVQKKDTRPHNTYTRTNVSLDAVRNKAFGTLSDDLAREFEEDVPKAPKKETHTFEVEESDNLLVDLSDDKPSVKEVTMGDALEYYNDLGLEYNVDYVDATKKMDVIKEEEIPLKSKSEEKFRVLQETETLTEEPKKASTRLSRLDDASDNEADDNLFDLIDSMYKDNE